MLKKVLITLSLCAFAGMMIMPATALAQDADADADTITDVSGWENISVETLITRIINWALGLIVLIAVLMIIYGGFTMMTSGGDDDKFGSGRDMVTYAIIGLIVAFLAWGLVSFVQNNLFQETTEENTSMISTFIS